MGDDDLLIQGNYQVNDDDDVDDDELMLRGDPRMGSGSREGMEQKLGADPAAPAKYGDKTAAEMGLSGVPGKSDDLRSALYANLAKRLNEKSPMVDLSRDVAETNRNNSLMALLGKASASMGTLGGKTADSSGLADMAKSENAANGQELQGYAADDQRKQQLQQYLMGKLTQQDVATKTAGWHQAANEERTRHNQAMEQKPNGGAVASFSPAGQDADGNILVMDHRTGKIVNSGQQGSRLAGAPKAGGDGSSGGSDPKLEKDWMKMNHEMTAGTASSRSDMGRQQATLTNADRLLTLGEQGKLQKGGLDKRQVHEAAIASAALVSGGSGAAQSTIEALVPHTSDNIQANIEEWLSSDPTGTNQQAFVNRMMETAQREKHLAGQKINGIKTDVMQGYAHLKKADPERWEKAVGYQLGKDAKFDDQGHYKASEFQAPTQAPAVGGAGTAMAAPAGASDQAAPDKGLHVPYAPDTMQMGGFTYKKVHGGWQKVSQ